MIYYMLLTILMNQCNRLCHGSNFKNDHYGEPEILLGSQLQWKNINGSECWTLTLNKYVTKALKTLRGTLKEQNKQLPFKKHQHLYLTNISLRWIALLN